MAVSVYFMRADIKTAYLKVKGYIEQAQNKEPAFQEIKDPSETTSKGSISTSTPGPLKVLNSFLNHDSPSDLKQSETIRLTNEARAKNGNLPNLKENQTLDKSAKQKVDDMFAKQYFEHISPSGVGVSELGISAGYEYILIGENLALGNFKNEQALIDAWMASPGHRANILNKRFTEVGIAIKYGHFNGDNVWLAVQHFGLPKDSCPSVDFDLKTQIQNEQTQVKNIESTLNALKKEIDGEVAYNKEKVDEYNNLLNQYKNLTTKIGGEIEIYNKEVRAFNSCATGV